MKTKAKNQVSTATKYAFSKKPTYYFHADEDFREDREWGKEKGREMPMAKLPVSRADRAII